MGARPEDGRTKRNCKITRRRPPFRRCLRLQVATHCFREYRALRSRTQRGGPARSRRRRSVGPFSPRCGAPREPRPMAQLLPAGREFPLGQSAELQDERTETGVGPVELVSAGDVRRPFRDISLQIEQGTRGECHVSGGDCRRKISLALAHEIDERDVLGSPPAFVDGASSRIRSSACSPAVLFTLPHASASAVSSIRAVGNTSPLGMVAERPAARTVTTPRPSTIAVPASRSKMQAVCSSTPSTKAPSGRFLSMTERPAHPDSRSGCRESRPRCCRSGDDCRSNPRHRRDVESSSQCGSSPHL